MRTHLQRIIKKRDTLLHDKWSLRGALLFVVVFAALGTKLLFSSYAATQVGDLNGDKVVNSADLTVFLPHMQQSGSAIAEDFNKDSVVNIIDLSIILSNFGKTATPTPPVNTVLPSINGTTTQGLGLTVTTGTWSNTPTSYSYQWQDCNSSGTSCTNISGATASSYTLAAGDISHTIRAIVTATNADGNASATSVQSAVVAASGGGSSGWWKPSSSSPISWNWVIGNTPSTPYASVNVYDIDGFDNSAATVAAMHAQGIKVICYIDVGTFEPGRADGNLIPAADQGSAVQGWPGEKWLNISDVSGLTPMVQSRMNMCKSKGFDAIEPDNIDGYTNKTGFSAVTAAAQLTYNRFLATTAHNLGLSIGLKNDVDQTSALQPNFDWALNEECNKYTECDTMAPFTNAGKAVFNAEYTDDGETTAKFCAADAAAHINGVLFNLDLNGKTFQRCTQTW